MRVLILGGDGFCGWPTALHLSARGCEIGIVDNLSRRDIDTELGVQSLTPIEPLGARIEAWREIGGETIDYFPLTLGRDYDELLALIGEWRPDAVVHFAEQRAAPYSMKSSKHKRYTVRNNVCATHDILAAIVESERDVHLVHLGTMGVYGYGATAGAIPEGYLKVMIESDGVLVEREILHPVSPGSIYHLTKTQDQLLFQFYAKNDSLRITDLHQGIVWGCQTEETRADPRLVNRFDYDGDYGTVLNRFRGAGQDPQPDDRVLAGARPGRHGGAADRGGGRVRRQSAQRGQRERTRRLQPDPDRPRPGADHA